MTESRRDCDAPQFLTHLHKPLVFLAGGDVTERQEEDMYQLKLIAHKQL